MKRILKKKYQYLTIIKVGNGNEVYLRKVNGFTEHKKKEKSNIKLKSGKVISVTVIFVTIIICGICAIMFEPSFLADVLLSISSGLFTGLILLLYSGINARLRKYYNSKTTAFKNVSNEISNLIKQPIFHIKFDKEQLSLDVDCTVVSQIDDICKFVIELNGNKDILWLNKKNKKAKEKYSDLLRYACIMQSKTGKVVIKRCSALDNQSVESTDPKTINTQELYDYTRKTSSDLKHYKVFIDMLTIQIEQQIANFDKSIL